MISYHFAPNYTGSGNGTRRRILTSSKFLLAILLFASRFLISVSVGMRRVQAFVPCARQSSRASARCFSQRNEEESPQLVGIVGGGLAGLSTAYQLLQKSPSLDITIIDKAPPGTAGASSVAGGLLHPLSPKGKLVHLGLEGLSSTNALLDAAARFESETVLRNEIYRVALNELQESTLKRTAENLSELTQWFEPDELGWDQPEILGALRLHSGCKVVHMPTYLKGLWAACKSLGSGKKEWVVEDCTSSGVNWEQRLAKFDTVVLCAGAGLFQNSIIEDHLPINLIRGQSIELTLDKTTFEHAMLCGKYVTPLLEHNRVLVGATHEYEEEPLSQENVFADLKEKSYPFASNIWDDARIDKYTCGFRVQSDRGRYGRMPIIGRYDTQIHKNAWIFTGLSSRGLLYHGVFGDMLTKMILGLDEEELEHPDLDWWNKK